MSTEVAVARPVAAPAPATVVGGRLSRYVYDELKSRLLAGEHPAGSALSVEELRTEFGVSKQPVMEALRLLASDGLVEIIPQVGISVRSYTTQETHDFYRMFAGFEGSITAVAAERATARDIAALQAHAASMHSLEESSDAGARSAGYREGNRTFHALIHGMARSPIMMESSRRLWDLSDFLISTFGVANAMAPVLGDRNHDHDRITAALERRDSDAARRAMEDHILGTVDILSPD